MKNLDTVLSSTLSRMTEENRLEAVIASLNVAANSVSKEDAKNIIDVMDEKLKDLIFLKSNKTWNFNFASGGWNSITAADREEAFSLASKEYNEPSREFDYEVINDLGELETKVQKVAPTVVLETSLRIATTKDTANLMSLFH